MEGAVMRKLPFLLSATALYVLAAAPLASAGNFDAQLAQCVKQ